MKIISVVGTRPNLIKIAPFCASLKKHNPSAEHLLIHTGQHYDINMSKNFFDTLGLPSPDINLEAASTNSMELTEKIMVSFEKICMKHKPDWVVVVGDVDSTLAAALTAKMFGIKIAHIEAGLRSFDLSMPEETNRILTDSISDLLFAPCRFSVDNLLNEGIEETKIKFVGNILIDSLIANLKKAKSCKPFEQYEIKEKEYFLITCHRPSNVDNKESFSKIIKVLNQVGKNTPLIFPLHPRTKKRIKECRLEGASQNIRFIEPLAYHDALSLMMNAKGVVTDSGGIQEETSYLGIPCLTLRDNTERPITIETGSNRLTNTNRLESDIKNITASIASPEIPLWDGKTADRIVKHFL